MSMLNVLGEKLLPQPIKDGLVAYCPTMDLIALATADENVQVFRLNGQKVFGVSNKNPQSKVVQLRWKPNGRLLAIAFSDDIVWLVNSHTGKTVHRSENIDTSETSICCLGWGVTFTDAQTTRTQLRELKEDIAVDDVVSRGLQTIVSDLPADLPAELAALDVESILPKLSVLPIGSKDDEIFSTRVSIDSLFHSSRKEQNESTDILVVGSSCGDLHLSIYDTFALGRFGTGDTGTKLLRHSSHPYSSTHALLFSRGEAKNRELCFAPLDLRLVTETGRYLSLIASKSTQLQSLLRYIKATQVQIYNEFNSSQDLPRRFIQNIEESLHEKNQGSFLNAAYHLVATGDCYDTMKQWLVDELGDRGQKRWEKATTTGYENLRRLTHENLLPALQRLSILVSRLRGLSRFHDANITLGLETLELDQIFDTVNCLQLLSHTVLIYSGSELRQFGAFSSWLRQEIEIQATDPVSTTAEENNDRDSVHDYQQILQYIRGAMQESQLYELFHLQKEDQRSYWDIDGEDIALYERYKSEVKKIRQGTRPEKQLPGLESLISALDNQCRIVFQRIADAQARKVRIGDSIKVGDNVDYYDMKMLVLNENDSQDAVTVFLAMVCNREAPDILVSRLDFSITNGISTLTSSRATGICLPVRIKIGDLKFVDDTTLILIVSDDASSSIVYVPYLEGNSVQTRTVYQSITPGQGFRSLQNASIWRLSPAEFDGFVRHRFPSPNHTWLPRSLEVNGRKGRRALCAVSRDRLHYALFDLDSRQGQDLEEGEEGMVGHDTAKFGDDSNEMLL